MYSRLSPDERFKMVIRSFVEGNESQREMLVNSCPKETYLKSDNTYTDMIEASKDIVAVFIIQLLEYDKVISLMKIFKGGVKEVEIMKKINEIQAFIVAFETFCEKFVGIKTKDMIQAWYGYDERFLNKMDRIKAFLETYQLDIDTELKQKWLEKVFINEWKKRIHS